MSGDKTFVRLDEIQGAGDVGSLGDAFERAVADFGATGFALCSFAETEVDFYPGIDRGLNGWVQYYDATSLFRSCPIAVRIFQSPTSFAWRDVQDEGTAGGYRMFSAAQAHGVTDGIVIPMPTRAGHRGSAFVKADTRKLSSAAKQSLLMLGVAAHIRFDRLHHRHRHEVLAPLSSREREVLSWFAAGKSAEDVARIIGIAPTTVMFHYRHAAHRYGTLNRTHTVVEAMRRGDIEPGQPANDA